MLRLNSLPALQQKRRSKMLEERGIVTALDGKYTLVQTAIKSTCSGCSTSSCGTSALAKHFTDKSTEIKVLNSQGAKAGDNVVIGIDENSMLHASFLVYLLPLITLFIGGYLGELGADNPLFGEWSSILGGVIGFGVGVFLAKQQGARNAPHLQAVMLHCDNSRKINFNL